MNRLSLCSIITLLLAFTASLAQTPPGAEEPWERYGVYIDLNLNHHVADFRALPGVPNCCPRFESGNGVGTSFGLFYQHPFSESLSALLRAGFSSNSGTLTSNEGTVVIVNGQPVAGEFEHTVKTSLATWGVEPLAALRLVGRLRAYGGMRVSAVTTKTYEQKETISQPTTTGTFENGQRTRNENAGELPDGSSLFASVLLGAGLDLPLNSDRTLLATPEVFYSIGVTPVVKDLTWRVNTFRLGVALGYAPRSTTTEPEPPPTPQSSTPVASSKPGLLAAISAFGLDEGTLRPNVTLRVEEFVSTNMRPLLNYLFFDENSSAIPARYARLSPSETSAFRLANLHDVETLPTYYQVLNIIGRRMLDHPGATITLTGCNADMKEEQGNMELSKRRAESVRDYLKNVWGIAEGRMRIEARNLPGKPTDPADPDGATENRRVEIASDSWEILEPVITDDTLRTTTPPSIRFQPEVRAQAGVARWTVTATQSGQKLKEFSGAGAIPATLDWNVNEEKSSVPRAPDTITYRLDLTDSTGQSLTAPLGSLPVEQITIRKKRVERIADREIDRYSLILFDFDQSDLNPANRRIAEFIKGRVSPAAEVSITGYTDRVGEADHNLKLSQDRAQTVARTLNVTPKNQRGLGESAPPYSNDLPEGRFYSRTVNIVVETMVE